MENALLSLFIYKHNRMWVFDDPAVDLVKEPFVMGIDKMIDHFVADFKDPDNGFNVIFSTKPFPGHQASLEMSHEAFDGAWYECVETGQMGWLCPALRKYYEDPPEKMYALFTE